jgi:hypothetical protein
MKTTSSCLIRTGTFGLSGTSSGEGRFSVSIHNVPVAGPISWDRVRAIFGNPLPPPAVWERQFDYCDKDLHRIARTPYEEFDFGDLWYYYLDLAYVELQPDLFAYLFPVCLMDWHDTLMKNESCSHGDSEFHKGIHGGDVFNKMVTPGQEAEIYGFFRDSFVSRLDIERGFGSPNPDSFAYPERWLFRFNSLGLIMPRIDLLWNAWWCCDTRGRALTVLKYCSELMYVDWENPLFTQYGAPPLWGNDSEIYDCGWLDENIRFLSGILTVEYLHDRLRAAVSRLTGESEEALAQQVLLDWPKCRDLVSERSQELPVLLKQEHAGRLIEWTV